MANAMYISYLTGKVAVAKCRMIVMFVIFSSTDAECKDLMDGFNPIKFTYNRCKTLIVPSTFSTVDLVLFKRNSY